MPFIPIRDQAGDIRAWARVSLEDFEWANAHRWCSDGKGYAMRTVRVDGRNRNVRLHREVLGLAYGDPREGDHVNGHTFDNRRSNLRVVSAAEQGQNRRDRRGVSRHRGVDRRGGRWRAQACHRHVGYFDTEAEAAEAAAAARRQSMPLSVA